MATVFGESLGDERVTANIPIGKALIPDLGPEAATALLLLDGLTPNEREIWLRNGQRMLDRHR